jgi:hypothetical protein
MHKSKLSSQSSIESLDPSRSQWIHVELPIYQNARCYTSSISIQGEAAITRISLDCSCSQSTLCILMVEKLGMASREASASQGPPNFPKSSPHHNTTHPIPSEHFTDSFNRYNSPSTRARDPSARTTPHCKPKFFDFSILQYANKFIGVNSLLHPSPTCVPVRPFSSVSSRSMSTVS